MRGRRAGCYARAVPRFTPRPLHAGAHLRITRWGCDGHDAPRPATEIATTPCVMVMLRGCFELRDRRGRHVADPGTAIAVDVGHEYQIRHPAGGDVTLAFAGALPRAFIADGPVARAVSPAAYVRLAALAAAPAIEPEAADEVALAALDLLAVGHAPRPGGPADREIARAIEHAIARRAGKDVDLPTLAAEANVSVAHACRAFRRATGATIHARVREARLRHALALLLDTDRPIVDIATAVGFANQGHLGNAFAARFGVSPGRARREPRAIAGADQPPATQCWSPETM